MEPLDRNDFIRCLLANPPNHGYVAEAVAAFLGRLPEGSRVGFYACGAIARAIITFKRETLERLDCFFILTDPQGKDLFEGFPLVAAASLQAVPPEHVIILSTQFAREMAAQVAWLGEDRIHQLVPLLEAYGVDAMMEEVLARIMAKIECEAARIEAALPPGRERILFFSPRPPQHIVKIMGEAVRQGFAVAVVVEDPFITPTISLAEYAGRGYFHALYVAELWPPVEFLELEKRLRPQVDHLEVSMGSARSLAYVMDRKSTPTAVEYRDFPQTVFRTREEAIKAWRMAPEAYDQETASQERIYLGADGIVMKDAPETLEFLADLYHHRPRHVLPFYHYFAEALAETGPVEKLSSRTGETHVVYAGGVVNDPKWHNYPLYHSLLAAGKALALQGIHLTIYNAGDSTGEGFEEYLQLDETCPYFHYRPAVPYDELKHVLPLHDFGWFCFDFSEAREHPFFHKITMGSKVFTYLEAGLPILISPEQEFMARMITQDLGIGIPLAFAELSRLAAILRSEPWEPVLERIREAQKKWTYLEHGHKLRRFYETLIKQGEVAGSPLPVAATLFRR